MYIYSYQKNIFDNIFYEVYSPFLNYQKKFTQGYDKNYLLIISNNNLYFWILNTEL